MCRSQKKFAFTSKGVARRYIRQSRRRGLTARHAYLCPHCGMWHLTSRKHWVEVS
jgi:hypothetical protein